MSIQINEITLRSMETKILILGVKHRNLHRNISVTRVYLDEENLDIQFRGSYRL